MTRRKIDVDVVVIYRFPVEIDGASSDEEAIQKAIQYVVEHHRTVLQPKFRCEVRPFDVSATISEDE